MRVWDRQPEESEKAYSAFKIYLEMSERSIKNVAEKLLVSVQHIRKWANKYDWKGRVAAYDSANFEGLRKSNLKLKISSMERKNSTACKLEEKALKALETINLSRISARSIVEMLTLANQLRNEAAEIETENDDSQKVTSITIRGI